MGDWADRYNGVLHAAVALLCVWLLASSPWIELYRTLEPDAGWITRSHVILGVAALAVAAVYAAACLLGGRWRLYFPWLAGNARMVLSDLGGIFRGRRPMSEGGGLFGAVEGLLLVALLAAGLTGVAWLATQGTSGAVAWRELHILAARTFAGLLLAHLIAVALHVIDLIRD